MTIFAKLKRPAIMADYPLFLIMSNYKDGGIRMADKLLKYSDATLVSVDDLIEFAENPSRLPHIVQHERPNILELVYIFETMINDDGANTEDKVVNEIANNFKILPIYYHIQIMRQLINRYYDEVFDDIEAIKPTVDTLDIRDALMDETDHCRKIFGRIPSPFEMLYLYIDTMSDDHCTASPEEQHDFRMMIGSEAMQQRVLLDYVDTYEKKYGEALHQEVMTIGK